MSVALVPSSAALEEERSIPIIRDVLVATDCSEVGDRAVAHGASLLPGGGTLHLAHVLSPAMAKTRLTTLVPMRPPSRDARAFAEARERLEALVPRELAGRGIRVEAHVLEGDVAHELCRLAARLAVDAVCMASHAHSGVAAAVLGSSTREVLATIDRPLFVVRLPRR
jgi:nucleotide-binding universal stress UspA family protein